MQRQELKSYREARSFSQAQLAEWLNAKLGRKYDRFRISRWEAGSEAIPASVALLIERESTMKGRIIAVAMQKGGVGKTTTSLNLAGGFVELGKRVLVIDADAQASATIGVGQDPVELTRRKTTLYHVMFEGAEIEKSIVDLADIGISLLPSTILMANGERMAVADTNSMFLLRKLLTPLRDKFDVIIIDTAPNLGAITFASLVAADEVLIPCKTAAFDAMSLPLILDTIQKVQEFSNPGLKLLGILPTIFNAQAVVDQRVLEEMQENYGQILPIFTPIPRSTGFDRAAYNGEVAMKALPKSHAGAAIYRDLARSLAGDSKGGQHAA